MSLLHHKINFTWFHWIIWYKPNTLRSLDLLGCLRVFLFQKSVHCFLLLSLPLLCFNLLPKSKSILGDWFSISSSYFPPFHCFHILLLFSQFRHNLVFSSAAKLKLEKNFTQFMKNYQSGGLFIFNFGLDHLRKDSPILPTKSTLTCSQLAWLKKHCELENSKEEMIRKVSILMKYLYQDM